MNQQKRLADFLAHLLVSCNRIAEVRRTVSHQQFLDDYKIHELVLRFIESLGESARRIENADPTFFEANGIEMARNVIGMRNRIAHQYEGVDLDLVWEVVVTYAPELRNAIVPVLLKLRPDADLDSLHF